jgi:hypothetical protein
MDAKDTKDVITLLLGAVGTTLGVVNYVRTLVNERVRLRVLPKLAFATGGGFLSDSLGARLPEFLREYGAPFISADVINLSKFPITISEIGLCEGGVKPRRAAFLNPTLVEDGRTWPMRLEPREAGMLVSGEDAANYPFTSRTRLYVMTACDKTVLATSKALGAWTRMREASAPGD